MLLHFSILAFASETSLYMEVLTHWYICSSVASIISSFLCSLWKIVLCLYAPSISNLLFKNIYLCICIYNFLLTCKWYFECREIKEYVGFIWESLSFFVYFSYLICYIFTLIIMSIPFFQNLHVSQYTYQQVFPLKMTQQVKYYTNIIIFCN